jgi:hypothetical protein
MANRAHKKRQKGIALGLLTQWSLWRVTVRTSEFHATLRVLAYGFWRGIIPTIILSFQCFDLLTKLSTRGARPRWVLAQGCR